MKLRTVLAVFVAFSFLAFHAPSARADSTIVDVAVADGRFTTLAAALEAAGLIETLQSDGPFTVFAPTDEAFARLPAGTVEALLNDIPTLTSILLYHVVPGRALAADVVKLESADTALGKPVAITVSHGRVRVNESRVVLTDVQASNGVIHVIDRVLLPPAEAGPNEYIVQRGDTLFAIAQRLLGDGRRFPEIVRMTNRLNGLDQGYARISNPNLIYIGDKLALPRNIVETAVNDGRFTTLVAAVQAADLVGTLQGPGPFTVFAPTDEAFAKLPDGTLEALLEDIPTLTNILLYHVVPGEVRASQVVTLDSAETAQGSAVQIRVENGRALINDATVVITDIPTTNGVIHVIDTVILPPQS
jgi:transforming growth factor-beta-induced protein